MKTIFLPFSCLITLASSTVLINTSDSSVSLKFPSYNAFQTLLPNSGIPLQLLPIDLNSSCHFDFSQLKTNKLSQNDTDNASCLVVSLNDRCVDYIDPIQSISLGLDMIKSKGYGALKAVLLTGYKGDRRLIGSPNSGLFSAELDILPTVSYVVVPNENFVETLADSSKSITITVLDTLNPWKKLLGSNMFTIWSIAFKVIQFLLITAQILLCGFVASRTKFKGRLQMGLLLVGIFHLGGSLVLSWTDAKPLTISLYTTLLLLPACLMNSLVVVSWCQIVSRLRTTVRVKPFKLSVLIEGFTVSFILIGEAILIAFMFLFIGNNTSWFVGLSLFTLTTITTVPSLMGIWFVFNAMKFCPTFHSTAKLINAQWFTMFILMTRIFFILLLVSNHLVQLMVNSPESYLAFTTLNNIAIVAYNTMILLTVIKLQSISKVKHQWTSEQLGLDENGVVATEKPEMVENGSENDNPFNHIPKNDPFSYQQYLNQFQSSDSTPTPSMP